MGDTSSFLACRAQMSEASSPYGRRTMERRRARWCGARHRV